MAGDRGVSWAAARWPPTPASPEEPAIGDWSNPGKPNSGILSWRRREDAGDGGGIVGFRGRRPAGDPGLGGGPTRRGVGAGGRRGRGAPVGDKEGQHLPHPGYDLGQAAELVPDQLLSRALHRQAQYRHNMIPPRATVQRFRKNGVPVWPLWPLLFFGASPVLDLLLVTGDPTTASGTRSHRRSRTARREARCGDQRSGRHRRPRRPAVSAGVHTSPAEALPQLVHGAPITGDGFRSLRRHYGGGPGSLKIRTGSWQVLQLPDYAIARLPNYGGEPGWGFLPLRFSSALLCALCG